VTAADRTGGQHAGGGPAATSPVVAEPSFAERARTLVHLGRTGTLATVSRRHAGWPFASVMPYGLAAAGRPTFLISTMAMHTQNLAADARASLLVTQPGWNGDPLAGARVTVMGPVAAVPPEEVAAARAAYLARHAGAASWVDFDDFGFYRLAVADVYFVGGFGAMGWVAAEAYAAAVPDPLADVATDIVAHMNADHADALVLYCRAFGGVEADEATMTSVDRLGFGLRVRAGERVHGLRLAFPREVRSAATARAVLIEMLRDARSR
jgi:putative heme iron utilization protein